MPLELLLKILFGPFEAAEKLTIFNINQYENDYFNIPIKHLITIADFFHVSIDYLLDNQSEVSDNKQYHHVDAATSGARLKAWRKENKLTQEKLAGILNTTHSNIAFYEKGRNLIATPFLYMICHKYHVSADYLLGRIDYNIKKTENSFSVIFC